MTSTSWWQRIKRDTVGLHAWLYDQYRGEVTAADRIETLRDTYCQPSESAYRILTVIAAQERDHARWVGELLAARGLDVAVRDKADRYWPAVLPGITDLGVRALAAELERYKRIVTIAQERKLYPKTLSV